MVSIPNGMEFYEAVYWGKWQGEKRFNSQRDGILRGAARKNGASARVSIPNGMEFYRFLPIRPNRWNLFQFPTGWNSTK